MRESASHQEKCIVYVVTQASFLSERERMFIVMLRSVNCRCCSHLGCSSSRHRCRCRRRHCVVVVIVVAVAVVVVVASNFIC